MYLFVIPRKVSWLIVGTNKRKGGGGVGIRSLSLLNQALLGKWCQRYVFVGDFFWKQIIQGKYGQEGEG